MIIIKTQEEIEKIKEGGAILASVLRDVSKKVKPGVTTGELNAYAHELIEKKGGVSAFLDYTPDGASYPYPASLCVSVNAEVVHGIPDDTRILNEGDIVSLDLGIKYKGLFTDHAVTVPVGEISKENKKLLSVTREALMAGIKAAQVGNTIGDIGYAIESIIKPYGFGIIDILAGHGVGRAIHEDPYVPNYGKPGQGAKLKAGMVIAIEPMVNLGKKNVYLEEDDYTYTTTDGLPSAHFEHTVIITDTGPVIATQ